MKAKIINILKRDFVRVLGLTAFSNFLKIVINLISTKVVAVLIGPQGVALIGQFNNLMTLATITSSGGISNGIVKYVSEFKSEKSKYESYVNTALYITLISSIVTAIGIIIFAKSICLLLFSDLTYISIIYIVSLTITLYALNSFFLSIINGMKLYDKFILINLISSVCGLIFTVILVYFYRMYGALLALATYQSIVILITINIVRRNNLFSIRNFKFNYSKIIGKQLFSFSLMAFIALIWPLVNILTRTTIINEISVDSAGIWDGMNRISLLISALIGTAIATFYLPRLSEIIDNKTLRTEILSGMKLMLSITFIMILGLYIFRDMIIDILFTHQFSSMADLFFYQLLGDFFWVAKMTLSVNMLAKAMTKQYIYVELGFGMLYYILSRIFIHYGFGIEGVSMSHFIYNLLYFIAMIFIFRDLLFQKHEEKLV